MILGFFFVRPVTVSLPEDELNREVHSETSSSAYDQRNSSRTPLLNHDLHINRQDDDDARIVVEPNPSLRPQNCEASRRSSIRGGAMAATLDILPNVHGKKLWCSSDFWLLFGIHSIRTFTCLSTVVVHP
jgi:hypothetical protein